jgi:hypothetical protein
MSLMTLPVTFCFQGWLCWCGSNKEQRIQAKPMGQAAAVPNFV